MRQVRIDAFCDFCWLDGEQQTPATHSFAVGAMVATTKFPAVKLLETCEPHSKPVLDLIGVLSGAVAFKADAVVTAAKPAAAVGPPSAQAVDCPVCGHSLTKSGMVTHIWSKHVPTERPAPPDHCPECDDRSYSTPQGLALHRRHAHGHDAVEDALNHVPDYRPR
jgi:hypothetical protein